MSDEFSLSTVCVPNRYFLCEWLAALREITQHPRLCEEGKFLWLWLVAQSVDCIPFYCSFSYEQLANAMKKTPQVIHHLLLELLAMGLLSANIPICFQDLTPEMIQTVRNMRLRMPARLLYSTRYIDV